MLAAGALDAHYQPVYMKKNRPAYELVVLCREQDRQKLEKIIFEETTTIGVRYSVMQRDILVRRCDSVATEYGNIQVKVCTAEAGERYYVEYDSAVQAAKKYNIPLQNVYFAVKIAQKNIK